MKKEQSTKYPNKIGRADSWTRYMWGKEKSDEYWEMSEIASGMTYWRLDNETVKD